MSRMLRIASIFNSVDGEVNFFGQGTFTTFIRFAGCNLDCWKDSGVINGCDTPFARPMDSGTLVTVGRVLSTVNDFNCKKVTITGGEPLLQMIAFDDLVKDLINVLGCKVTVETNGSIDPQESKMFQYVDSWVVDWKLESSGMDQMMIPIYKFAKLRSKDYIKFVIGDRSDFDMAFFFVSQLRKMGSHPRIAFGPLEPLLKPSVLVEWMKERGLFDVQLNIQLHKYLGLVEDQKPS
jgi:7-carboxy-7-deazaguanine synthase